jgi:hypothetical protein
VHPWEASAGRHLYRLNTVNLAVGAVAEAAEAAAAQQQHHDPRGGWWADEAVADGWTVVDDRGVLQDTAQALADGGTGGPSGAAAAVGVRGAGGAAATPLPAAAGGPGTWPPAIVLRSLEGPIMRRFPGAAPGNVICRTAALALARAWCKGWHEGCTMGYLASLLQAPAARAALHASGATFEQVLAGHPDVFEVVHKGTEGVRYRLNIPNLVGRQVGGQQAGAVGGSSSGSTTPRAATPASPAPAAPAALATAASPCAKGALAAPAALVAPASPGAAAAPAALAAPASPGAAARSVVATQSAAATATGTLSGPVAQAPATAPTAALAPAASSVSEDEARALASAVWPGADQESAAKRALAVALLQLGPGATHTTRLYGAHSMHHSNAGAILKAHSCPKDRQELLQRDATGCFR